MTTKTHKTQKKNGNHEALAKGLTGLLADTYVLYSTTQFYHWNVEGPQFHQLHEMFEQQYRAMAEAIDLIAERIRVLGYYTPGTLADFDKLSRCRQEANLRDHQRMLQHLIEGHQQVAHRIREIQGLAEQALDEATADLLIERLRVHEKTAWMLKSQAGEESHAIKISSAMKQTATAAPAGM